MSCLSHRRQVATVLRCQHMCARAEEKMQVQGPRRVVNSPGLVCYSAHPCSLILPDTHFTHSTQQGQGSWVAEGYRG